MTKLSDAERTRVSNILTKCAQDTKHIDDVTELNNTVFNILSKELGHNPGLFKAACQTYNSCKSIYRLESADDNTRGNSFAILDVQKMMDKLNEQSAVALRKSAAAPAMFSKVTQASSKIEKAAAESEVERTSNAQKPNIAVPTDKHSIRAYIKTELAELESTLHKAASAVRAAEAAADTRMRELFHDLEAMSENDRITALSKIAANYGSYGKALLAVFEDVAPRCRVSDKPGFKRYVGSPSLGSEKIYKKASETVEALRYAENIETRNNFMLLKGADALTTYAQCFGIQKSAAAPLGSVVAGTGIGIGKEVSKLLGINQEDASDMLKKIYNAEYVNEILGHSYGRAFMNAAMDDSIAKYPLDKLVSAFNSAIAKLPLPVRGRPATEQQALINSLMINALATGSAPSKADTDTIESLQTAFRQIDPAVAVTEGSK